MKYLIPILLGALLIITGFFASAIDTGIAMFLMLAGTGITAIYMLFIIAESIINWPMVKWYIHEWRTARRRKQEHLRRRMHMFLENKHLKDRWPHPDHYQITAIQIKRKWKTIKVTFLCGKPSIFVGMECEHVDPLMTHLEKITNRKIRLHVKPTSVWG